MPWFQARERIQIAPNNYVEADERFEYPYQAGLALVGANRADWSERPSRPTTPPSDAGESGVSSEANESSEPASLEEVDWTDIEGVGEATASDFEDWIDDEGLETVDGLIEAGVEGLPGVGESMAEDVREYLKTVTRRDQ